MKEDAVEPRPLPGSITSPFFLFKNHQGRNLNFHSKGIKAVTRLKEVKY